MNGIAASAYTTLEEYGVVLDAVASQRFEHSVRVRTACDYRTQQSQDPELLPVLLRACPLDMLDARIPVMCPRCRCYGLTEGPAVILAVRGSSVCRVDFTAHDDVALQAFAKWRLMWRLMPRLLEFWNRAGRLPAMNLALLETTSKVRPTAIVISYTILKQGSSLNPMLVNLIVATHAYVVASQSHGCRFSGMLLLPADGTRRAAQPAQPRAPAEPGRACGALALP